MAFGSNCEGRKSVLDMQLQTDEMRRAMGEANGVVPRRPGLMDACHVFLTR